MKHASGSRPRWRRLLPWLRWGAVALLASLLLLDLLFPLPLPTRRDASVLVVARDGSPLRAFADADGVWRYPTTPEQVSPLYLQALLGYEDRWFWRHPGINPLALLRAGGQLLGSRRIVSGGSTLTMQVARIIDPGLRGARTRTPSGKLRQLLRALQLEAHLSKREILTLYLDRAPFGGTIAHGYLVVGLIPMLARNIVEYAGMARGLNYGINKVRFTNPVPVGCRVRMRFGIKSVSQRGGAYHMISECTIEVENESRPACVAEVVSLLYPG